MLETLAPKRSVRRLTAEEAREIVIEAYHYLYPLVLMHVTRRFFINQPLGTRPGAGPEAMFHHVREFPAGEEYRPNFDMLYSSAWLDLSKGPYVISVPSTEGHYYVMAAYDMWTDAFAVIGTHTTGSIPGTFVIAPLDWNGLLPNGVECLRGPTTHVWVNLQIQTRGAKDYSAVHQLQNGFTLAHLTEQTRPTQKIDPAVDTFTRPREQVQAMAPGNFFKNAADFMKTDMPHNTDWSIVARMRRIGLEPGKPFHIKKSPVAVQAELDKAVGEARQRMAWKTRTVAPVVNGWQLDTSSVGVYGNDYLKRAVVASVDLCVLPSAEAIFCSSLEIIEGGQRADTDRYVLHFNKDQLPPVNAFWSVTMYDPEGFPARNSPNRVIIRDCRELDYNSDGSLDILIQKEPPGADRMPNWLPLPEGQIVMTMRLYSPRPEALDGRWVPPVIQRVSASGM
jgi:hypothetical protein